MMHGAGDVANPAQDSVAVMEEILVDYLTDIVRCLGYFISGASSHAYRNGSTISQCIEAHRLSTNSRKLRVDDVRHALREPQLAKQLGRVEELFAQQKLQRMLRQQMVRFSLLLVSTVF
jgi:transcription initiation factor TFIID subunit 13